MTARELWQQRLTELETETNPWPAGTFRDDTWKLAHSLRVLAAGVMVALAPLVDYVATIDEEDR